MKIRTLEFLLMVLAVVMVLIASGEKEEEIYGTWVNSDYNASAEMAKLIINSDPGIRDDANGTRIMYTRESDEQPEFYLTFRIAEKWKDDDGNIWYKIEPFAETVYYELWKISNSGNTLELDISRQNYPEDIDPNHADYRIYYRQE